MDGVFGVAIDAYAYAAKLNSPAEHRLAVGSDCRANVEVVDALEGANGLATGDFKCLYLAFLAIAAEAAVGGADNLAVGRQAGPLMAKAADQKGLEP